METMGLHVGAGVDAMATGPTPIHDELTRPVPTAVPDRPRSRWQRFLAFLGLGE